MSGRENGSNTEENEWSIGVSGWNAADRILRGPRGGRAEVVPLIGAAVDASVKWPHSSRNGIFGFSGWDRSVPSPGTG